MTQPDENQPAENQPDRTPRDRLRAGLLISGLSDWVPLAEVETAIFHYRLSENERTRKDLAVQTVRSLLEDGLMRIGDLPYPGEKFTGWNLSIDAAMERVHDLFVAHHDEPALWEFRVWLGLTPAGEQLAQRLRNQSED